MSSPATILTPHIGIVDNLVTATYKDVTIPENSYQTIIDRDSFKSWGIIQRLSFKNCIIPSISDAFTERHPDVAEIEIADSIISKIELIHLKEFKKLNRFCLKNATVEEFSDTIFGNLKDLTVNFEKRPFCDNWTIKFEGTATDGNLDVHESDSQEPKTFTFNSRPIIKPKSIFGSQNSHPFGQLHVFPDMGVANPFNLPEPPTKRPIEAKKPAESDQRSMLKDRNTKLLTINANLMKELNMIREQLMKLETDNKRFAESGYLADLKKIFADEAFKDFTVNVSYGQDTRLFKVHKILFAARSSVIANMIRTDPDKNYELNLQDIPLDIFEYLLDFIYNETPPVDNGELIATYAAAGGLKIVDLRNLIATRLLDKIDDQNSLKLLKLSNKYGNEELRMRSFEKIKGQLAEYKMTDDFAKNPEMIEKLLARKRAMDEEFEKMRLEIEGAGIVVDEEEASASTATSDDYEVVD